MSGELKPSNEEAELCEKLLFELCGEFDIRVIDKESTNPSWRPRTSHLAVDSLDEPEEEEKSLRNIWSTTKENLSGLVNVMFDFLQSLDSKDLTNAARILRASYGTKRDIVVAILEFIADRLGKTAIADKEEHFEVAPKRDNEDK